MVDTFPAGSNDFCTICPYLLPSSRYDDVVFYVTLVPRAEPMNFAICVSDDGRFVGVCFCHRTMRRPRVYNGWTDAEQWGHLIGRIQLSGESDIFTKVHVSAAEGRLLL